MSYLGDISSTFVNWVTGQINSLIAKDASFPVQKEFVSAQQTITAAGALTIPHGLGVIPKFLTAYLVCIVAENGYPVGATLPVQVTQVATSALDGKGGTINLDATNINVRFGNAGGASNYDLAHATTGAPVGINNANWKIVYKAYA